LTKSIEKKEEVEKRETNRDGSSLKGSKCHLTERKCGMNLLFFFSNGVVVCCFGNQNTGMPTPSNGRLFNIMREWRPI
jgi:hypothetical protein